MICQWDTGDKCIIRGGGFWFEVDTGPLADTNMSCLQVLV